MTCGYGCGSSAPTSTPVPSVTFAPTTAPTVFVCEDDEAGLQEAGGPNSCTEAKYFGYCPDYLCPTCTFAGYCDVTCGFNGCGDGSICADALDEQLTNWTGFDGCAEFIVVAPDTCSTEFAPGGNASGGCDLSCGFCNATNVTDTCADYDNAAEIIFGGYNCSKVASLSDGYYCDYVMCPTCDISGLCDESCGYCSDGRRLEHAGGVLNAGTQVKTALRGTTKAATWTKSLQTALSGATNVVLKMKADKLRAKAKGLAGKVDAKLKTMRLHHQAKQRKLSTDSTNKAREDRTSIEEDRTILAKTSANKVMGNLLTLDKRSKDVESKEAE